MVHFIPLPKLPSAMETADHVSSCTVCQFTSWVWGVFCKAIGGSASLSSGFHLQTNGQSETWNLCSAASQLVIQHPGAHIFPGWNMLTIRSPRLPPECHRSWRLMVFSLNYSRPRRRRSRFRQSRPTYVAVSSCGDMPELPCLPQRSRISSWWTSSGSSSTLPSRAEGLAGHSRIKWILGSWHPGTLGHLRSRKSSMLFFRF